jgi:hypothetical protein
MNFKELYEAIIGEHGDVYTVEELLKRYSKWEVSARKMKDIVRLLRQKGYYKLGIRGLVPDVEPRNEIEQKAKELVAAPNFEFWRAHSALTEWIKDNLTEEQKIKIYQQYGTSSMGAIENIALKIFTYGLIIFPPDFGGGSYDEEKEIKRKLNEDLKSIFVGNHFAYLEKDTKEWGITQFKVYKEYDLDKETDKEWGDIASEL